jgi:type IV pilus assembly protein PilN
MKALDLLRQRRLALGGPAQVPSLAQDRHQLQRGAALGVAAVGLVLLLWVVLALRQRQLAAELDQLRLIPAQVEALEQQSRRSSIQLRQLRSSNQGLAEGLVAVSSGSALLSQLARITPQGVQISEASVDAAGLRLKGVAVDPEPFRRVNALTLLLAASPLVEAQGLRVVKLLREAPTSSGKAPPAPPPVAWELLAPLARLSPERQRVLLQDLGADGMARRLQILSQAGVMP